MERAMSLSLASRKLRNTRREFFRCLENPKKAESLLNQIARIMHAGWGFYPQMKREQLVVALNFFNEWPHIREKFFAMMKKYPKLMKELRSNGLRRNYKNNSPR